MIVPLSSTIRRCAAVLLLLLFGGILWAGALRPLLSSWQAAGERTIQAQRLLTAYQHVMQDRPQWDAVLKEMQTDKYIRVFLRGDDRNLASAQFQASVKETIEASGGMVQSIQLLATTNDHDLERVSVRVNFSTPLESLAELLRKVEHGAPYVFLDNLSISAPENGPDVKGKPVILTIRSDFQAYLHPEIP